jgi:hypothetical protein
MIPLSDISTRMTMLLLSLAVIVCMLKKGFALSICRPWFLTILQNLNLRRL